MKSIFKISLLGAALVALTNCSAGSIGGSGAVVLTPGGQAFKTVDEALNGVKNLSPAPAAAFVAASHDVGTMGLGLGIFWDTDTFMSNPKYDGSCPAYSAPVTFKEYMGTQFDENQKRCNDSAINIFGRMKNSAGITCVVLNTLSATTSASLAGAAPQAITFDSTTVAALRTKCPMIDLSSEVGNTVTLTFSTPAATTYYDLKIAISPMSETVLMKFGTGNEINFAGGEDNVNGRTRTIVFYNTLTKVLRAEYISKSKGVDFPLYIHRLYADATTDEARIYSSIASGYTTEDATLNTNQHDYIVTGKPASSSNDLAFATKLFGFSSHNAAFEACITPATGALISEPAVAANAFTCGAVNGRDVAYATAYGSINTITSAPGPTWHVISTGSEAINWTGKDDMLTSGL